MVFLETLQVFHRGNTRIYDSAAVLVIPDGDPDVLRLVRRTPLHRGACVSLRRPCGWPSMVCIVTLLGGLILLALGIMGLYIAKIYLETKKRQIFIVREQR